MHFKILFLLVVLLLFPAMILAKTESNQVQDSFEDIDLLDKDIDQATPVIIILKQQPLKKITEKIKDSESRFSSLSKKQLNDNIIQEIKQTSKKDKDKIKGILEECNASIISESNIISSVSALISNDCLKELKKSDQVKAIYKDKILTTELDHAKNAMNSQTFYNSGYFGSANVAVVDTGIDSSHPDLNVFKQAVFHNQGQFSSNYDDNPNNPDDLQGHGTHIAGIIASSDSAYKGIAYNSNLINAKFGYKTKIGNGEGSEIDSMDAIDWAVQQGADVISYSFGSAVSEDDCLDCIYIDAIVDDFETPVVVAAGNSGSNLKTITAPAIAYNIIAVGAIDDKNTGARADDVITSYSSRGPTKAGRIKPDISAPGNKIMSTNAFWENSNDFLEKSGTSMACPMVTASVSLLLDKNPDLNPKEIKAILINSADSEGTFSDKNKYGWGYINLENTYNQINNIKSDIIYEKDKQPNIRYYKTSLKNKNKATLVWNRHVIYDISEYSLTYYSLNDLDLKLFDEEDNYLISESISGINNVEQVKADNDYNNAVIKIEAYDPVFNFQEYEEYALATTTNILEVSQPDLTIIQGLPENSDLNFIISSTITNNGDLAAHNIEITLNLPSGLSIISGNNPKIISKLPGRDSTAILWIIRPSDSKTYNNIYTEFESESYDEIYSGQTPADSIIINKSENCTPNWQPFYTECQSNDTITKYYFDINECNMPEEKPQDINIECDYCTPLWIQKNTSCLSNNEKTSYYTDQNNCYQKTKLESDNHPPNNVSYECDYSGFITITSPENKTYNTRRVPLTITTQEKVDLYCSLNNLRPRKLCVFCDFYNRAFSFIEGFNSIKITAQTPYQDYEKTVNFTIDSKPPRIIHIYPKNKDYATGIFTVQYYETDLKKATLYYGNDIESTADCESGKNSECVFNVSLKQYENQTIEYYFVLEDQVSSSTSKIYSINIDTIPPNITIKNTIDNRFVYLNITLSEKAKYLNYIYNGKERRLCSRCSSTYRRITFPIGQHNLTIKAVDYANNINQKNITLNINY